MLMLDSKQASVTVLALTFLGTCVTQACDISKIHIIFDFSKPYMTYFQKTKSLSEKGNFQFLNTETSLLGKWLTLKEIAFSKIFFLIFGSHTTMLETREQEYMMEANANLYVVR